MLGLQRVPRGPYYPRARRADRIFLTLNKEYYRQIALSSTLKLVFAKHSALFASSPLHYNDRR